ncbi:MAG: methyltransferase [Candidatus Pacebacteria bacterium]|nr:methyltransferase [Candidatus Paceibacterota bacterium]
MSLLDRRARLIRQIGRLTVEKLYVFGEIKLFLDRHTLAPHYNTAKLINLASGVIKKDSSLMTIADVGTGSGFIAISLARQYPERSFLASDICPHCIRLAEKSAKENGIKNINFFLNKDRIWLSEFSNQRLDFIISNPPFIGEKEFRSEEFKKSCPELEFEPVEALLTRGDELGMGPLLEIVKNSRKNKTSAYLFMANCLTIEDVKKKLLQEVNARISIVKDFEGLKRFLLIFPDRR